MPCPFPEHHKSSGGDSGIGTIALAVLAVLVVGAIAGPIVAAAAELVHIVFIAVAVLMGLVVLSGTALLAYRLRHRRPNGTTQVSFLRAVQRRPAQALSALQPSVAALPAPGRAAEIHLHLYGVPAEEIARIISSQGNPATVIEEDDHG